MKYVANGPTFVIVYVIAMIPTYLLPYAGSNSFAMNSAGSALGVGISPQFFMHLIALLILCAIGWIRGGYVGKQWLVTFPILALCFDLLPGLNYVPMIPTVMHIVTIGLGVASPPVTKTA